MANLVTKTAILTASITVVKMFFECGTVCVCRVAFSKSKEFCLWMINHVWNSWSNYVWLPKSRKIPFNYLHIDYKKLSHQSHLAKFRGTHLSCQMKIGEGCKKVFNFWTFNNFFTILILCVIKFMNFQSTTI